MPKVLQWGNKGEYVFRCPGCKSLHVINTINPNHNRAKWSFSGTLDNPSFTPSINCKYEFPAGAPPKICHFIITNGMIDFKSECSHGLAGHIIAMPDIENFDDL